MANAPLTEEEQEAILSLAERLKAMGPDPVATLRYAVEAEAWVREHQPDAMKKSIMSPDEILALLEAAVPMLNVTNTPDPLHCAKLIWSLRFWRMGRYIGIRNEGDEIIDEIADVVAMRQKGAGRPDRPLYQNLGDIQDWKLYRDMVLWFTEARRLVPPELTQANEIADALGRPGSRVPGLPPVFVPDLSRALSRFRTRRGRGAFSPRDVTALWFMEYKKKKPQSDVVAATREIDRLGRLARRANARNFGEKRRT
jgi:hypothetical protein